MLTMLQTQIMFWQITKQIPARGLPDFVDKDMHALAITTLEIGGDHQRNTNIGELFLLIFPLKCLDK